MQGLKVFFGGGLKIPLVEVETDVSTAEVCSQLQDTC